MKQTFHSHSHSYSVLENNEEVRKRKKEKKNYFLDRQPREGGRMSRRGIGTGNNGKTETEI